MSMVNGATAIAAGIVAQLFEDQLGHIGPFQAAIALTVLALFLVMRWEENYGDGSSSEDPGSESGQGQPSDESGVLTQFKQGWGLTLKVSERDTRRRRRAK